MVSSLYAIINTFLSDFIGWAISVMFHRDKRINFVVVVNPKRLILINIDE